MDKTIPGKLMTILTAVLSVVGLLFILKSVFNESGSYQDLIIGLACVVIGNLINFLRLHRRNKGEER